MKIQYARDHLQVSFEKILQILQNYFTSTPEDIRKPKVLCNWIISIKFI